VVAASEYTVVNYIYLKKIITNVGFFLFGIASTILIKKKQGFENLFLQSSLYSLFNLFFEVYFWIKCSNLALAIKKTFIMDFLMDLGYSFVSMAYFLAFKKFIEFSNLPYFIIPHILLTAPRMFMGSERQAYTNNQIWGFFEALQIMWISLKLENPSGQPDWIYVLLLLYIVVGFLLFLSVISCISFPCVLVAYFKSTEEQAEQKPVVLLASKVIFTTSWKGISYFTLLRNFHAMVKENKVAPGMPISPSGDSLYYINIVMTIFSFIDIFYSMIVSNTFKKFISSMMLISNKTQDITAQNLSGSVNMQLMQVGANYFQKRNTQAKGAGAGKGEGEGEQVKKAPEILDCMICCDKPSATVIRPCNHGGICEECMIRYLEGKNICPHCKTSITKVYIVDYDEKKKNFMAKRIIKCQ
jgi:hypothetical protein